MNGIIGMAEQLRFTSLDPEQRQMVGIINQAEGLLQDRCAGYSKLDVGKMELAPTSLLRELIDSVLTMTSSELQRKAGCNSICG
jgi:signal transduction histidine kinase